MPDTHLPLNDATTTTDRLFPTLTAAPVVRISMHGHRRPITAGDILVEVGDKAVPFFVVVSGAIQILRRSGGTDTLIVTHRPGEFLGEANMISGRRALIRALVSESGEALELDRQQLMTLVQTDAELSEILMRAFILRRLELIANGFGDVVVIGGGNSAGQAAVFLAETVKRVHMLVRANGLADTMSRYLVRRSDDNPAIILQLGTEIVAVEGEGHLERVRWRHLAQDRLEAHDIRHVFIMAGAVPNTAWLQRCVVVDDNGFIKTGPDLSPEDLMTAAWPLARPPFLLETSRPGIFAVGDVRAGNIKRVASAVGEGSIAIAFVHQVLRQ